MAIFFAIVLLLLGATLLAIAWLIMAVRQAVQSFLGGFPKQFQEMMMQADPRAKKSMEILERLPLISKCVAAGGALFLLFGVLLIHSPAGKMIVVGLGIIVAGLLAVFGKRIKPLVQKQIMTTLQNQAKAQMPKPGQMPAGLKNLQGMPGMRTMPNQSKAKQQQRAGASGKPPTQRKPRPTPPASKQ